MSHDFNLQARKNVNGVGRNASYTWYCCILNSSSRRSATRLWSSDWKWLLAEEGDLPSGKIIMESEDRLLFTARTRSGFFNSSLKVLGLDEKLLQWGLDC